MAVFLCLQHIHRAALEGELDFNFCGGQHFFKSGAISVIHWH